MSLRQAHPFLTLTDRDARPELTMEEGRTEGIHMYTLILTN